METAAYIFLAFTIFFFCAALVFEILYIFDVNGAFEGGVICLIFCIALGIGFLITGTLSEKQSKSVIKEFPLTEWKVNYKITTMNEKSDTTLVLTKIN